MEEDKGERYLAPGRQYGNALLGVRHQEEEEEVAITFRHFFEFSMVASCRFAVGTSLLSVIVSGFQRCKYFASVGYFRLPVVSEIAWNYFLLSLSSICRWNFDYIYHTLGDISTSGLSGHIAISVYRASSKSSSSRRVENPNHSL